MTTYEMKPIKSGTRLRAGHDVFATVIIGDFNPADTLRGDEVWEAPANGAEVVKGDKWLHVTHRNGVELAEKGWTAIVHKGVPVCNNFKEVTTTPPPANEPIVPLSFILTDPATGKRAEYAFVRILDAG